MPIALDLTNRIFGRLKVIEKSPERNKHGKIQWLCLCDPELSGCGNTLLVQSSHLSAGSTRSCGCLAIDVTKQTNTKHGYTAFPEYKVWNAIKRRCYEPTTESYKNYGARGITMADEWRESFEAFMKDMGPRPSKYHSIERENNNGQYCKDNCVWATVKEQANNRRSSVHYVFDGMRKTLPQWCEILGIPHSRTWQRIKKLKWSFNKIVYSAMAEREISFSTSGLEKDTITQPLEWWCQLLCLDKDSTYLKIFRGQTLGEICLE